MPIDQSREFLPLQFGILTVSDSRTFETDTSGKLLVELIENDGHSVAKRDIVTDDLSAIISRLNDWIADTGIDAVLTTGGTGVTGRDTTPEALAAVWDKEIPGFGELFRWLSYESIGTSTIQSRATGGVAQGTYIFALPGSKGACRDGWEKILRYQFDSRHRPCNLVELMPRLQEHVEAGPIVVDES